MKSIMVRRNHELTENFYSATSQTWSLNKFTICECSVIGKMFASRLVQYLKACFDAV